MNYTRLYTNLTAAGHRLRFTWHGGEYVEITLMGDRYPSEVINVWDHALDRAQYDFTPESLDRIAADWVAEYEAQIPELYENSRY
jgi:hypothetical protein